LCSLYAGELFVVSGFTGVCMNPCERPDRGLRQPDDVQLG
jgi:hypothetical protein